MKFKRLVAIFLVMTMTIGALPSLVFADENDGAPAETKIVESTEPEEKKPAKPAETKSAETKPAETKPVETTKPAETEPAETTVKETEKPAGQIASAVSCINSFSFRAFCDSKFSLDILSEQFIIIEIF